MKNFLVKKSRYILAVYFGVVTIILIALAALGYKYIAFNENVWLGTNVAAVLFILVLCFISREAITRMSTAISILMPLTVLIHMGAVVAAVDSVNDYYIAIYCWLCFCGCFALSFKNGGRLIAKTVCGILNSVLLVLFLIVTFFILTFGQIGLNTVLQRVDSPNSYHVAVLIDSDQGALGGSTVVNIESKGINILLGEFVKRTRVYLGRWGEFENMMLEWEDNRTLLINGKPYEID